MTSKRWLVPVFLAATWETAPAAAQEFTPNHLFVSGDSVSSGTAVVFEFDPSGARVRTLATAAGATTFYGVAFGPDGNLYAANAGGTTIVRIHADGTSEVFVDGVGGLASPNGLAFGPDGHLFVASVNHQVIRIDPAGNFVSAVTTGAEEIPDGVSFAPDGTLLVGIDRVSGGNDLSEVARFDIAGNRISSFGAAELDQFIANVVFAPDGRIVVADYTNEELDVFAPDGQPLLTLPNPGIDTWGLAIGPDGQIHGAAYEAKLVAVFDLPGGFQRSFTDPDVDALSYLAFAPWRFTASIKGGLVEEGADDEKAKDTRVTLSIAPGSNQVMLALEEGGALATQLGSAWHVFHGFEAADADGKKRSFHGKQLSGVLGGTRSGSLNLEIKGKADEHGFFTVKSAKGTLHFSEAGRQLVQVKISTSKLLK